MLLLFRYAILQDSLLSNGHRRSFLEVKSGRSVKFITHINLVLRSRMSAAIPLFP
jgi:hypothetical protein